MHAKRVIVFLNGLGCIVGRLILARKQAIKSSDLFLCLCAVMLDTDTDRITDCDDLTDCAVPAHCKAGMREASELRSPCSPHEQAFASPPSACSSAAPPCWWGAAGTSAWKPTGCRAQTGQQQPCSACAGGSTRRTRVQPGTTQALTQKLLVQHATPTMHVKEGRVAPGSTTLCSREWPDRLAPATQLTCGGAWPRAHLSMRACRPAWRSAASLARYLR